ncbi:MAG: 4-(cytidine 5'-diphospho)-2-C-methyl-D-erythritol kinase [Bacteroidota bacterium]
MICFPNAKINLGLRVLRKRPDGYHDIETVFFPIPLSDILELVGSSAFSEGTPLSLPSGHKLFYSSSGNDFISNPISDLTVKACVAFDHSFGIDSDIVLHIHKNIPSGAGLGGGSSDAAHALISLNSIHGNKVGQSDLLHLASTLGSDCPFFIVNKPCHALGRGEQLIPIDFDLKGYHLLLVKPPMGVSTAEAYGAVKPIDDPSIPSLVEIVKQPVELWPSLLKNDFETGVFQRHPELAAIKSKLYDMGASYAAMSGSGSTMYGLFSYKPEHGSSFENCFTFLCEL